MIHLTVGVTGHRDLPDGDHSEIESRVETFFRKLQKTFPDLPLQLITALAEGADQLVARVALNLDIPVVVILPMERSDYERDFGSSESRFAFRTLLKQARQVITLPQVSPAEPGMELENRQRQYAQLGIFVSNHCQILLALWDGKEGTALGGTGQVVRYHLTAVMEGFEEEVSPAALLAENENDLVYHIVCARDRPDGDPGSEFTLHETSWISSRDGGERSKELPETYRTLLSRLQQFVRDRREHDHAVAEYSNSLLENLPDLKVPPAARLTDRLFQLADSLAIHYQKRVDVSLKATYSLAVVMGFVFLVYSESDGAEYLVLIFLALFFSGVGMNLVAQRRDWHRKYLDYRVLAEGLRVQLYWNLSGVVASGSADFAYDNFLQKQDVDLGWVRHVMRLASLQRDRSSPPNPGWVRWVIDQWIGESEMGQGQVAYYTRKQQENSARFRKTQLLGNLSLWTGIAIAFLLYLSGGQELAGQRQVLLILMGVLPLIAGIWDAYSHKKAEKELIKQYHFMSQIFTRARRLVSGSLEIAFQRRVLKALGQAALEEGTEWLLIHRERPPEHSGL